jgi:hypothetical protein
MGSGIGITSPSILRASSSVIRWCFGLGTSASASRESIPPAERTASALTGIPPFKPTTVRFSRRPAAMRGAAGIHLFTARNASRRAYEPISIAAPTTRESRPSTSGTGSACRTIPPNARAHQLTRIGSKFLKRPPAR